MPEREKPNELPEEDERMLAGLTDQINAEEVVKWPEQDFIDMDPEMRKRLCEQLINYYLEQCNEQIAILEKFKDDPEKSQLLDHWKKIREGLKAGHPESLLKETEARINVQIDQLLEINGRIAALPANDLKRLNLSKYKETVVDRLEKLMSDQRNLFFIDNYYEIDKKPEINPEFSQEVIKELDLFCQRMIREINDTGDEVGVINEKDWQQLRVDLEKSNVNSLYGALCHWSAELAQEKKQLMYNITNPPKNMNEDEKEATAEMVRIFQKNVKRQADVEGMIYKIEALKDTKE